MQQVPETPYRRPASFLLNGHNSKSPACCGNVCPLVLYSRTKTLFELPSCKPTSRCTEFMIIMWCFSFLIYPISSSMMLIIKQLEPKYRRFTLYDTGAVVHVGYGDDQRLEEPCLEEDFGLISRWCVRSCGTDRNAMLIGCSKSEGPQAI